MLSEAKQCLLSIDVEDWFHLIGAGIGYQLKGDDPGVGAWDSFPGRVEYTTNWILDTLDEDQVKGTFFILGWVAKKFPELVKEIHNRGHEIASHSYWHKILKVQERDEFRKDVRMSLDVLQNITGEKVAGFRISSATVDDWAVDILAEEGLIYDSSLFPVTYHDVYGSLSNTDNNKAIEKLKNGLWEVKLSSLNIGNKWLPWSGGGYFRLLPYPVFKWGMNRILKERGVFNFYIHPWELDDKPPILNNLRFPYKMRRYVFIKRTRPRFKRLLKDFKFIPIITKLEELNQSDIHDSASDK